MSIKQKLEQFQQYIWRNETSSSSYQSQLLLFLKIFSLVIRDLIGGMLSLRAMSLVYTTLLSLVPLIAVSFSVLKGFGVHNQIEPMLSNMLLPLGDKGPEITQQIISFVDNMKMGVLGSVGLVMLIYTVISLISKIESAFNYTWRISASRTPAQRFSNYLSIVMVGPVMMFAAIGLTASLSSNSVIDTLNSYAFIGQVLHFFGYLLPFVFIIAAFTFVYLLVPNVHVTFKSAFYGAFFSGIVWELLGHAFASFASGSTSYTAIYSGFAILILFMIWLYLGWLVLLTGANIAFYHQHPERLKWDSKKLSLSGHLKEQSMLLIMFFVAKHHAKANTHAVTLPLLCQQLKMPDETLIPLIKLMEKDGFIKSTNDEPAQLLPAQSIELISVADIIKCAHQTLKKGQSIASNEPIISQLMQQHEQAIDNAFLNSNFSTLISKS